MLRCGADCACLHAGAILGGGVATSAFETATEEDLHFIADSSQADVVVVDNAEQLRKIMAIRSRLPKLRAVVQAHGAPDQSQAGSLQLLSWTDLLS